MLSTVRRTVAAASTPTCLNGFSALGRMLSTQAQATIAMPQSTSSSSSSPSSSSSTSPSPSSPAMGTPDPLTMVKVKAYYVARGIDVLRVHSNLYGANRQQFDTKSVTITIDKQLNQYISIFNYGSCVFFNIPAAQHMEHLRRIREAAVSSAIAEGVQHTDDYRVMISDQLEKASVIKAEHVNIRCLDTNNIVIVGTVMAQTVALDYYAVAVERMLENFMRMNMKIEESGNFDLLDKQGLYKLIATNNTVITNVLSKLGIFEGTDAAWDNADYYLTWEALRKDFEIDNRFRDLSLKLDIVKDNTRFFLEMSHNQKSTKLEWTIIVLIAAEICISIGGHLLPYVVGVPGSH